jgi:hypothetical protein
MALNELRPKARICAASHLSSRTSGLQVFAAEWMITWFKKFRVG